MYGTINLRNTSYITVHTSLTVSESDFLKIEAAEIRFLRLVTGCTLHGQEKKWNYATRTENYKQTGKDWTVLNRNDYKFDWSTFSERMRIASGNWNRTEGTKNTGHLRKHCRGIVLAFVYLRSDQTSCSLGDDVFLKYVLNIIDIILQTIWYNYYNVH